MNEFFELFSPKQSFVFHLAGMAFSFFGIVIAKWHFYMRHKVKKEMICIEEKFVLKKWIKENIIEVGVVLLSSYILVRFVDVLLQWNWFQDKSKALLGFNIPLTNDEVFYYFAAGCILSYLIHKLYRKNKNK